MHLVLESNLLGGTSIIPIVELVKTSKQINEQTLKHIKFLMLLKVTGQTEGMELFTYSKSD